MNKGSIVRTPDQKTVISFHRSHRRVTVSYQIIFGGVVTLAATLVLLGVKLAMLPELTASSSLLLRDFFADYNITGAMQTIPLWGGSSLTVFYVQPAVPSTQLCGLVVCAGLLIFLLFYRLPVPRPLVVIVNLLTFMVSFYAALFLIFPGGFNSATLTLAEFFMEISLVTALTLPVLFWVVIFPLPTSAIWKLLNILAMEAVLFALYWLKYALFTMLCAYCTYLITPLVIFFLCSMLDIIYLITLFSLMVSRISRRVARDVRVWQWA